MPEIVHYPEGHVLISQDEAGEYFYIIVKGTVEVYQETDDGAVMQLCVLERGAHFGEVSLLKDIPRTANVRTLTPCDFIVFRREAFQELIRGNAHLRESLEHEVAFLLRSVEDNAAELT